MFHRAVFSLTLLFGIAAVIVPDSVSAQGGGDLVVSPTRVVFEGRTRVAQVSLANRGSATSTFRISLIDMEMSDKGEMKETIAPAKTQNSAKSMIRYAPRQIDIPPGGTQVVRLSLRKSANLADGEYRSHIFFRAVPPEDAGRSVTDETALQQNELRIQLVPIYGVTIPVIVRNGTLKVDVGMDKIDVLPKTDKTPTSLQINLTRTGKRSAFGDLVATLRPAAGGEEIVVGRISRIAVYSPNQQRQIVLPLRTPEGVSLLGGTVHVTYQATEEEGGKVLVEGDVKL